MKDKSGPLKEIGIKGIGRVYIRDGTSDNAVFDKIFKAAELDVMASGQFGWVKSKYDKMVGAGETPLIIDCGANIGLSTLFFSVMLPKARVVGIEPAHDNVELARKNVTGRSLVDILEAAVHDKIGALEIVDAQAEKWAYRVQEAREGTTKPTVPSVTINSLMEQYAAKSILIVKADIEGAEDALFRSNLEWLDRTELLIVEIHDWLFPGQGTSKNLFAALAGRQFEFLQNGENLFFFFQ